MNIYALLFGIGVAMLIAALAWRSDMRAWNGGYSPSGKPWMRFDTDSQGGRGYKDDNGNYCWISWPFVERHIVPPNAGGKP